MFIKVVKITDVPKGEVKTFEVQGKKVSIANVAGKFYAFDDTCSHEECSLGEGELEGTSVICPCHGAMFDVTNGKVLCLPAVEDIASYKIKIEGEDILVDL